MEPADLRVDIADHETTIEMVGGGSWAVPVGPRSLVENELEHADRPAPEQLTNALGIVADHLDDVLRAAPMVAGPAHVVFVGAHAEALARVELGVDDLDAARFDGEAEGDREGAASGDRYRLGRAAADEVFRTLVAEPVADRRHNPGLRGDEVETIIGTCCVVLAIMRRLELDSVGVARTTARPDGGTVAGGR